MTSYSLTERERDALLRVAKFRFLTAEQLEDFLFGARDDLKSSSRRVMTRQVLGSLQKHGLVARTPRAIGGVEAGSTHAAYYIRPAGIRAVCEVGTGIVPKRTAPRGTFLLRHALALADVAVALGKSARNHEGHGLVLWEPDWEAAQHGGTHIVVPDAYAVYVTPTDEVYAFVEMDLGTMGSRFFQRKIEHYLDLYRSKKWQERLPVWPSVLTVTPTATRAALLRSATERVLASQFDSERLNRATDFAFTDLEALKSKGPLGRIWLRPGSNKPEALLHDG